MGLPPDRERHPFFFRQVSIDSINVEEAIAEAKELMAKERMSPAMRSAINVLFLLVAALLSRLGLNSNNSSKPPSSDPNREKKKKVGTGKKRGGQNGHAGKTLEKVDDPDEVEEIVIDRSTLPDGGAGEYTPGGFEIRQVFNIEILTKVTEYRAEILFNEKGERFVAPFPTGVTSPVQYGDSVKAHAVYLSQHQLLPYDRMKEHFSDQMGLPMSPGSINNFNRKAYGLLEDFEESLRKRLIDSNVLNADETGINIDGKRRWLHGCSSASWTYFFSHEKRGKEAMDEMGILPFYRNILCHDHWKSYYRYGDIIHALCNAHHLRELEAAYELDGQRWAKEMKALLVEMKQVTEGAGGELTKEETELWRGKYETLIAKAEEECPPPEPPPKPIPGEKKKRGRLKRSKSRNLLERLRDFEDDTLRFMTNKDIPFTNNLGERDIRMTKVHQKISGCFRSEEGARMFCRIRSYLSSARKQGFTASYALESLFAGKDIFAEQG